MPTPDDLNEIESMLRDLPVREPSRMLDARVASALETTAGSRLAWLSIAAAVLLAGAVMLVILLNSTPLSPDTNPPVAMEDSNTPPDDATGDASPILTVSNPTEALNLTWTRDVAEETRYTPTGEPYRAVVREAVDHKAWIDTETGETGHLRIPREELIVVKQTTF